MDPITGRRADQLNGQATDSGSPASRQQGSTGTSLEPSRVWQPADRRRPHDTGGSGEPERGVPERGVPERGVPEQRGIPENDGESRHGGVSERAGLSETSSASESRWYGTETGWYRSDPAHGSEAARRDSDAERRGSDTERRGSDAEWRSPDDGRRGPEGTRRAELAPGVTHSVRRGKISHLARDSRMPAWRRRLLIVLVFFVAFTVLADWRVGLTLAVLAGIVDAVIRSRASSASSAEGLTSGAQRRTKRELAKLERSGYRALHVRSIPGTNEVIDHLLIGPTGVYAIDSEQWDKRLPVRTKNARQLWHGPFSQKERLEHARWEAAQASRLVGDALGEPVDVRPAMAVYGPAIPWGVATIRDVDVFGGDRLRKYLRRHPAGARAPRLTASEVERIYIVADRVLRPKQ